MRVGIAALEPSVVMRLLEFRILAASLCWTLRLKFAIQIDVRSTVMRHWACTDQLQ